MTRPIVREHLQLMTEPGLGWFRLFGRGIAWKDTTRHRLLLSERYGYVKYVRLGRWAISWLS